MPAYTLSCQYKRADTLSLNVNGYDGEGCVDLDFASQAFWIGELCGCNLHSQTTVKVPPKSRRVRTHASKQTSSH